jgi:hypothetical protein
MHEVVVFDFDFLCVAELRMKHIFNESDGRIVHCDANLPSELLHHCLAPARGKAFIASIILKCD